MEVEMRILVVDDEIASRRKLETIMREFGQCVAVETGTQALAAFKEAWELWRPFDVITLDVSMPGMDGTEVLNQIREMEKTKRVEKDKTATVFMVTAQSNKDTVVTSLQAGCDDYIKKPFKKEMILDKLKKRGFGHHPGWQANG
jgi:CheY-like chemotaxis protein